jgi:anthranilate synthase/aminodeoxychorismate synthase-like glutamine amidotransferase
MQKLQILLIDNYDSFTFNLYQQIAEVCKQRKKRPLIEIVKNDRVNINAVKKYNRIFISPGPKSPKDSGLSCDVIRRYHATIPILGVCLGHQCIGEVFGSKTIKAPVVRHGKTSAINHNNKGLFRTMPAPFNAARYHSLVMDKLPANFTLTAWTDDNLIMGIQHNKYPLYGVQFHPESFLTEQGGKLIDNFLDGDLNL